MKNVIAINFNRITNDGFIGFHNNMATAAASEQDSKRTVAFRNFRGTVKVLTGSLDQQRSALAKEEYAEALAGSELELASFRRPVDLFGYFTQNAA
ncbi:MAG: hypothetical protein MJY87_03530 [Fibrobacter sp.]|nr:hypothetical protein [Fibrobacter sp.]